jgi:hypothetical protein
MQGFATGVIGHREIATKHLSMSVILIITGHLALVTHVNFSEV